MQPRMIAGKHEIEQVGNDFAVAGGSLSASIITSILLYSPDCPAWNVRQVNSMYRAGDMSVGHIAVKRADGSRHDFLEVATMVDGYGIARERHECVACQDSAPRIT